jgi:DNA topoisomerase-1
VVDRNAPHAPHPFAAKLNRVAGKKAEVPDQATNDALVSRLKGETFRIARIERKDRRRPPQPPFITSSLQQEASRLLHFSPSHTMAVAQRLYEGVDLGDEGRVGLITYMRTDSVRLSNDAVEAAREVIAQRFGPEYVPPKPIPYKNKRSAQDAHEAIRATSAARIPSDLKDVLGRDEYRLYNLVYNRFVACQMVPAVYDQTTVDIEAGDTEFRATGSVLRFDGYLAAWRADREEKEREERERKEKEPEEKVEEAPVSKTQAKKVKKAKAEKKE